MHSLRRQEQPHERADRFGPVSFVYRGLRPDVRTLGWSCMYMVLYTATCAFAACTHPQRRALELAEGVDGVELGGDRGAVLRREPGQAVHEAGHDHVDAHARLQLRARTQQHLQRPQVELVRETLPSRRT